MECWDVAMMPSTRAESADGAVGFGVTEGAMVAAAVLNTVNALVKAAVRMRCPRPPIPRSRPPPLHAECGAERGRQHAHRIW